MTLFYDGQRSEDYSNRFDLKDKAADISGRPAQSLVVSRGRQRLVELHYVASHESGDRKLFFGRRVDQKQVNWPLLKSWLPECERFHNGLCDRRGKAAQDLPKNLRVIDIVEGKIVTAPPRCQYCAMTYVWGPIRREGTLLKQSWLKRDHKGREYADLPSVLPRTIADSMIVAGALGFRYLWNDSLCIVQGPEDAPQHKNSQIWRMDAIYSSAALTIAAATGSNADSGLPGVSLPRRIKQISEVVDGIRFAVPFPNYDIIHDDRSLIWNTRGWTMQEKLLSKRLLLFTDEQVYFKC
ncbi:HET-domain-containing protein, partial [Microthyrium microscopicum]